MCLQLDVQLIVTGSNRHPEYGMRTYHQYLEHLFDNRNPPDPVEQFAKGYEDFLQCPLQVGGGAVVLYVALGLMRSMIM